MKQIFCIVINEYLIFSSKKNPFTFQAEQWITHYISSKKPEKNFVIKKKIKNQLWFISTKTYPCRIYETIACWFNHILITIYIYKHINTHVTRLFSFKKHNMFAQTFWNQFMERILMTTQEKHNNAIIRLSWKINWHWRTMCYWL